MNDEIPDHGHANQSSLARWLDRLQQESWQLELIISGFVIFLLIGGWPWLVSLESEIRLLLGDSTSYRPVFFLYMTGRTAYLSLLICLLLHVVMRGLWIAAVGLRSVSGEIDYPALHYQPRFTTWLRSRIGSFDDYILRLERYCSVLFSVAFLILFCFISLGCWMLVIIALQEIFSWVTGYELSNQTGVFRGAGFFGIVLLVLSLVYFIDFATLGFFKRNRYTARPYYYLYRAMGWITFARLYRPIYYNLIDQRFGRRLARLLPVIVLLILMGVSVKVVKYTYYPYYLGDGSAFIDSGSYMEAGSWKPNFLGRITLEHRHPMNDYIEVFVPYVPVIHDPLIRRIQPDLNVARYTGVKLEGAFTVGQSGNGQASNDSLLLAFAALHQMFLNEQPTDTSPRFHTHPVRQQPGLLYMIPTHDLPLGEHSIRVRSRDLLEDELAWQEGYRIYFYK